MRLFTAMLVLAPGLFSTITGWPSFAARAWPRVRATTSTAPPGGKPTRRWIGFAGYGSAAWGMPKPATSAPERSRRIFMTGPLSRRGRGAAVILAVGNWLLGAELNHRHMDFQSTALPTEL